MASSQTSQGRGGEGRKGRAGHRPLVSRRLPHLAPAVSSRAGSLVSRRPSRLAPALSSGASRLVSPAVSSYAGRPVSAGCLARPSRFCWLSRASVSSRARVSSSARCLAPAVSRRLSRAGCLAPAVSRRLSRAGRLAPRPPVSPCAGGLALRWPCHLALAVCLALAVFILSWLSRFSLAVSSPAVSRRLSRAGRLVSHRPSHPALAVSPCWPSRLALAISF